MSAYGLEERRSTITHLKASGIAEGRIFQGSVDDDYEAPRDGSGRPYPYVVVDFGAPVRTTRDRNLAYGEKNQPHILTLNIAIISGDYDWSQTVADQVFDALLDWAPSQSSDAFEGKGGYGTRRPSTASTPTRYIEGLFLEAVVNNGIPD